MVKPMDKDEETEYNDEVEYEDAPDGDSNNLEHNYISILAFIKEEAEKKDRLDSLVRKCFKLTKMHRESNNLFE